ncbi:MAG TPA: nitronate monooxygenase [Candidatus Limnocylindria bacterium]|nr:nitronate monooxygenase [Candidatus Limnocylindria bacterium]
MIKTRLTELLGIRHPIVLGGMSGATTAELVAAVSGAGGLGTLGVSAMPADAIRGAVEKIRSLTDRPFGLNLLLFGVDEEQVDAVVAARPRVVATAWPRPEYDLRGLATRVHEAGALFMHQADTLGEAKRAAEAGADVVVAQGTEGGGHVGVMATLPLARMVIRAVPKIPVLVAGGIADGAGIAAVIVLGADGALLGTRFVATQESPFPEGYKRAIVESDGHDTLVTEIPDIVRGNVWPGAYSRVRRNSFIEHWLGREGELRRRSSDVLPQLDAARASGDVDRGVLFMGEDAGLIDSIEPAGALVERLAADAEKALRERGRLLVKA